MDPQNENRVYSVFTYVNVSEDGGKSFKDLMPSYGVSNGIHPDHHAWWIHPENGKFMIDGNDGGMNITNDRGKTWRFVGNIPVGQFYHVAVDNEYPYNVYGGMQDNGSWRGPAYVWRDQGIRNSYWQEIAFGDGFDVVPDRDNSRFGYAMSQQGNVVRYDHMTGNDYGVKPTHSDPNIMLRFNWNAAIGQDPFDNSTVYFGSQFVHKSTDKGLTWEVISPDLTTNDPEKQKQGESGGLTMDATGAENHCTILVIEPDPLQRNVLWTGSDDGRVHLTLDGGKQWTDVSEGLKGLPKGSWITQIKASNKNKGEALLVANDYRRSNYAPYVYRTSNYGKKWERIVDETDVASFALAVVEDPVTPNLLFLGTDDGLYLSLNRGEKWQKFDSKVFPTVSTSDLVIHPRDHDLAIATFGRAMWILDDVRPLRTLAQDLSISEKNVYLFEPPTAFLSSIQQPTGSRFGADALYNGTNKNTSAMFTFFANPKAEKSKDTLKLNIYEGDRLIRTLTRKMPEKKGLYRWYWRMDEKGGPSPSRSTRNMNQEPGGVTVLPGQYRAVLSFGDIQNEQLITVATDPRNESKMEDLRSVYDAAKKLEGMVALAYKATRQLTESKKIASDLKKQMEDIDKDQFKEAIEKCKVIIDAIDEEMAKYIGKEDKRQGITRNPEQHVMNRIFSASRYVRSRISGITATEEMLMQHAENSLMEVLDSTNSLFKEKWEVFRTEMEKQTISPFKEIEEITTN